MTLPKISLAQSNQKEQFDIVLDNNIELENKIIEVSDECNLQEAELRKGRAELSALLKENSMLREEQKYYRKSLNSIEHTVSNVNLYIEDIASYFELENKNLEDYKKNITQNIISKKFIQLSDDAKKVYNFVGEILRKAS